MMNALRIVSSEALPVNSAMAMELSRMSRYRRIVEVGEVSRFLVSSWTSRPSRGRGTRRWGVNVTGRE